MIDILIADDHELFRRGIKAVVSREADLRIVGEAANSREVLDRLEESRAGVVLLDLSMPGRGGLEVVREIGARYPKVSILVVSGHPEERYAVRCLRSGADGYVVKTSPPEILLEAVRKVASGGKYVGPGLGEKLAESLDNPTDVDPHQLLSDREFEVLRMIASGMRASEIADELCLSVKTISTYRSRVLEKLRLANTAQLMRYALDRKLV